MEIRYLDLGEVTPEIYTALWEYDNVIDLKEPTFIKFSTITSYVQFWRGPYWDKKIQEWKNDYTDLSTFYNSKELAGVPLCRCYIKIELNYGADIAYYIASPNGTDFILYVPDSDKNKRKNIDSMFQNTLCETLGDRNINTKIDGNDVYFELNGTYKKFSGSLYRPASNGFGYIDNGITYSFDFELANKLRRITNEINIKKFEAEDISEVVGGVWEVDSTIDKDEMDLEVISRMSKKLGLSVREDKLTTEEESKLFERGHRRLTEEEWYLYGNNENFEIRY